MTTSLLSAKLRDLAFQKGPGAKLPTVSELCAVFKTSRATLDDALRQLEQSHIIYRQHSKGIFVSPKIYRKTICILFDSSLLGGSSNSPFWGKLCSLFAQELQRRMEPKNEYYTFHFVVRSSEGKVLIPEEVREQMAEERIHAFLTIGLTANEWMEDDCTVPCIGYAGYNRWVVYEDFIDLLELGVKKLVEQGCQRISLWGPFLGHKSPPRLELRDTFFRLLIEQNRKVFPELVRGIPSNDSAMAEEHAPSFQEQGYATAMEIFSSSDQLRPDGVVVLDDMMTEGALIALRQQNVVIGEELKIATHSNVGSLLFIEKLSGLTVIEYNPAHVVQNMFDMLDLLLKGEQPTATLVKVLPAYRSVTKP